MEKYAITNYPLHDLLHRRWSPRAFDPTPLAAAEVGALLEAARWAPSCFNEQPWSFLVARIQEPDEHARMLSCLTERNQQWAKSAPLLLIAVARATFARNDKPNRHAWHDVGLAAAQLTVQASALGLVVHQMAGIDPERARELYAIPDGYDAATAIAIGRPGDPEALPEDFRTGERAERARKPLREIAFQGRWGEALEL